MRILVREWNCSRWDSATRKRGCLIATGEGL